LRGSHRYKSVIKVTTVWANVRKDNS
jgi:hypothetical protein